VPSRKGRASAVADGLPKLKEAAEQNYIELVMTIRQAQRMFALLPVKSNYSVPARNALLQRLVSDLSGIPLRIIQLSRDSWNAAQLIADAAAELNGRGAIVLLGLEETPAIVPAGGEEGKRPLTLAVLNHGREAIRSRCPYPLIVWCDPSTYRTLREHAPDFYDHFTGLFSFEGSKDAEAEGGREIPPSATPDLKVSAEVPSILVRGAPASLAFYERQLAGFQEPTPERARALLGLAETLWADADRNAAARLDRAEHAAVEALTIISRDATPADWARGQLILGLIYSADSQHIIGERLEEAIACYKSALQVYQEAKFPIEWAKVQTRLGIAYANLPTGNRAENLGLAIACLERASRVWTEADFPRDWATTQINLGNAHLMLPAGKPAENFRRAIACFESALRVYREEVYARDWAMTQYNLGFAYSYLPTGDRTENLRRAIACYEAALRVLTRVAFPDGWASTQMNLGVAYARLPTGDRCEHLRHAIATFEAALGVWTEAGSPQDRAMTQHNLERARQELNRLQSAPS
jgi:tetratricopeptide (TPR) repeat protein